MTTQMTKALCAALLATGLSTTTLLAETPTTPTTAFETTSLGNHFKVTLYPENGNAPIGALHNWIVEITDNEGYPLYPIRIALGGGMAEHGHGLPTQPMVTDYLGDGKHRIEGVKFNMAGEWTLRVGIEYGDKRDIAETVFELDF